MPLDLQDDLGILSSESKLGLQDDLGILKSDVSPGMQKLQKRIAEGTPGERKSAIIMSRLAQQIPFAKRGLSLATGRSLEEVNRTLSQFEPKPRDLGEQLTAGITDVVPTLAFASPFVKGAGALTKIPKFLRPAAGFGGYEGLKAVSQGDEPLPAALSGAGSALAFGVGSKLGASIVLRGIPFAEILGSVLGGGAVGAAMSPEEEKVAGGLMGGGFGLLSPSRRAPLSSFGKPFGRAFSSAAGVKPEVFKEVEQRGFREVLQKKYFSKKMPEDLQHRIENNLDTLEKGAIGMFDQATAPLRETSVDFPQIRGEVINEYNKVKRNPFKGEVRQLNDKISEGVVNTEVKNLGDLLDLRRFLADELYTSNRQGVKSKFGKDVYDIFNKYLHQNEILKQADADWTILQNTLREGKQLTGETGENFLRRFSKLTGKQKEKLALLEKQIGGEPFIEDLTNWSLAQEYSTRSASLNFNPFTGFGLLTKAERPLVRGYLRGTEAIGKGLDVGQEAMNIGSERLRSSLERQLGSERGSVILPGGYTNRTYDLISSTPQNVWDAEQLKGFLKGKVSQAELDTLGIDKLQGKVNKQEILDLVKSSMPQIEEVVKGQDKIDLMDAAENEAREFLARRNKLSPEVEDLFDKWRKNNYDPEYGSEIDAVLEKNGGKGLLDYAQEGADKNFRVETKFSQYQLPGGENYREVLIKTPSTSESILQQLYPGKTVKDLTINEIKNIQNQLQHQFKSPHWDEPNVLAHLRMNDRTTSDGKKVLFIEEIQSDWAKEIRENEKQITRLMAENKWSRERIIQAMKDSGRYPNTPNNPLLKNWQELALKRTLKEAVDKGYDYVSWITGEQQAERYDLSKQMDSIKWNKYEYGSKEITQVTLKPKGSESTLVFPIDKNGVIKKPQTSGIIDSWEGKNISEVIGKGIGERILSKSIGELSGLDLKIGGEWAKNLYDRQIPNILKDLTKGSVENVELGGTKWRKINASREPFKLTQPAFLLTPEIRSKVKAGLPLFSALAPLASQEKEEKTPYERITSAEMTNESDPWIRTKAKESGSSAFGEVQITKGLVDTVLKNPKKYSLDKEDIGLLTWLSQQQALMLKYGGKDMKPGMERYDYGGKGDWKDELIPKYRKAIGKVIETMSKQHGKRFWKVWRYGEAGARNRFNQDKRYEKEFNK